MADSDILQLRKRHPCRVPCYVTCKEWDSPLKLLCPSDMTMSQLLVTIRMRRKIEADKSAAYMLCCNGTFPCGTHSIVRYDVKKSEAVQFVLMRENTFG